MKALLLAIALLLPLASCAGQVVGTQSWFEQHSYGKQALTKRASFDLSCPANQLATTCLGADCTSAGVQGCDQKASYVFVTDKWVLNSDGESTAKKTEPTIEREIESAEADSEPATEPHSGKQSYHIDGRPLADVGAIELRAAIEKAGWKSSGFTYGGTFKTLELFGVAAERGRINVVVGMTVLAKTPKDDPVKGCPAGKELTTMYSCSFFRGPGQLLHSALDEESEAFLFITNQGGATEKNTKPLLDALLGNVALH